MQDLRDFFNDVVARTSPVPFPEGAVVSVYLNTERRFAFVEFRTIELCTAAMDLDGACRHCPAAGHAHA